MFGAARTPESLRFICVHLRHLRLIVLSLAVVGTVSGQEAKVRTSLATKDELWVGLRITMAVELLAPGFFSGAAAFDLPDPQGMLLIPPSGSPIVSSETIDGVSYTVQRHELAVFAKRGGAQMVPAFTVRFHYKRQPLDKDAVAAAVKTEPVIFTAKLPPGAEKIGNLISARDLKVVEAWKPEPGTAKAGDAFTRTITFTAPDVPAMAFPPFPAGKIDGLGIYPKAPEVRDHTDRSNLTGERRDTITYVCERPGQFTIPAARLTWFDLGAKQLQTIDLPARTFSVAPNPAMAAESGAAQGADMNWGIAADAVAVASLLALAVAFRVRLRSIVMRRLVPFRPVHLQPLNPVPQT
jgi:hypothetical protein